MQYSDNPFWHEPEVMLARISYPEYDLTEILRYAKLEGVKMVMHNQTRGSATNYDRPMDPALRFMNKFGYESLKTGYVGQITLRGERYNGQ